MSGRNINGQGTQAGKRDMQAQPVDEPLVVSIAELANQWHNGTDLESQPSSQPHRPVPDDVLNRGGWTPVVFIELVCFRHGFMQPGQFILKGEYIGMSGFQGNGCRSDGFPVQGVSSHEAALQHQRLCQVPPGGRSSQVLGGKLFGHLNGLQVAAFRLREGPP
ncbi:hypothetical protein ES703_05766 [subsurface metagenome]